MNTLPQMLRVACLASFLFPLAEQSSARELPIRQVTDVIQQWTVDQHLYVKGDLGISPDQLNRLELWLDENGPHWTVVMLRDAEGEAYQALDGQTYWGMDAVEHALGHGLANRTSFGELENPTTAETDGAVFVIFLNERKFSYYGSDAHDRRALGESHWVGELDREAIRAMRNGGRILDAVRNTVKLINTRLDQAIVAEADARQEAALAEARVQLERARAIESLRQRIREAETQMIPAVSKSADELRADFPDAKGDLTNPPLEKWKEQLTQLSKDLTADNVRGSQKQTQETVQDIHRYLNAYNDHKSIAEMTAPVAERVKKLGTGPNQIAKPMHNEALSLLEQAKEARNAGQSDFAALIRKADEAIDRGDVAITAEKERQRKAAARRRLIRNTAIVSALITSAILAVALIWLNRRRKPAFERAQKALKEREQSVAAEMERVYSLIERSSELLGSKDKVAARGYAGATRELSDRTLEDVDDLLVMSTEVERVMDEARELIKPKNPAAKVGNMFSGSRFERGVNRITGEPLTFTREKGLPLVITRDAETHEKTNPDGEPPESISMTFEEVFKAFHDRSDSASETLDVIENSLLDVNDNLAKLQQSINEATELDSLLDTEAEEDGYFVTPALFDQAIPAAQKDYDAADLISGSDPVKATRHHIPAGFQKISETLTVAKSIQVARTKVFPKLDIASPELEELGYDIKWMEQAVFELRDRADKLFATVPSESIAVDADVFSTDVVNLGIRAQQTVELAKQLNDTTAPAIEQLHDKTQSARNTVATSLKIDRGEALHEHQRDPDVCVANARELLSAARAALHHGGVEAVTRALKVLDDHLQEGHSFVDETLSSLSAFESNLRSRQAEYDSANGELPPHRELVHNAEQTFAQSALQLQAGDPGVSNDQVTMTSLLANCEEQLSKAERALQDSNTIHQRGQVLEAADLLKDAGLSIEDANHKFDDITQHSKLLEGKSRENLANLTKMVRRTETVASRVHEARTQRNTISRFEKVVRDIQSAQQEIEASPTNRDPFRDADTLLQLDRELDSIEALIEADHNAHAEAARAVEGAKGQLRTAEGLVHESRTDQLPDSATVQACQREIGSLGKAVATTDSKLKNPHEDWQTVDAEAARIHAELGIVTGRLRDELEMAQRSVAELRRASQEVFEATRWTGGHGIRISGSPGSSELDRARRALKSGNYSQMVQMSRAAIMAAQQAIQMARREVMRREREAARAAEAARRRRAAAARRRAAAAGGASILGKGGSSRGNKGAWSGRSKSSSTRSSGSGFSRSGW